MASAKPSALVDTRVIYCGDLIYIDPPFNSNRNYEKSLPPSFHQKTARFTD